MFSLPGAAISTLLGQDVAILHNSPALIDSIGAEGSAGHSETVPSYAGVEESMGSLLVAMEAVWQGCYHHLQNGPLGRGAPAMKTAEWWGRRRAQAERSLGWRCIYHLAVLTGSTAHLHQPWLTHCGSGCRCGRPFLAAAGLLGN